MQKSILILSLSFLICLSFANDEVNECSSCEMPCRVSDPNLPRSVLTKIYSNSVDNYRVTTILDGYDGHFKITISQNGAIYSAMVNVVNWPFAAHCKILCETPVVIPVPGDTIQLRVKFSTFRSFLVHLQLSEDSLTSILLEKVGFLQDEFSAKLENELNSFNEELHSFDEESHSFDEKLQKVTMQAKLKYAISNATITGNGWTCGTPNPMIYPTGNKHCGISSGNWVYFDLKEKFTLNLIRFRLHDQGSRTYTYSLAISPDRINWVTLAAGVSGQSAQEYLLDSPTEVRYIKMEGRNNNDQYLRMCTISVDWV